MDRCASMPASLDALELRVLAGPQRGARAPLQTGRACVLAADAALPSVAADIVLRDGRAAPAAVRIMPELDHALVEVLHGEVTLNGQVLGAGAQAAWPRGSALQLGAAQVAFGLACEDDWSAVGSPGVGGDRPPGSGRAAGAATPLPLRRRPEFWLACVGASVLMLCAAALGITRAGAEATPVVETPDAAAVAQQLGRSEFADLSAQTLADGRLVVRGRLATLAQRARLDAWLAELGARASVEVVVDESVAREATEVFRVNGIAAQVRVAGPGRLVAEAAEPDGAKLARAQEVVRRDVRGIDTLTLRNAAPPPAPPPPVVTDPGKRIAAIVPGDPAYVVTADGSRYFVGALLPSGHRITGVAPQRLTLVRDGQESTLNF
jgi:type III secretion protein D